MHRNRIGKVLISDLPHLFLRRRCPGLAGRRWALRTWHHRPQRKCSHRGAPKYLQRQNIATAEISNGILSSRAIEIILPFSVWDFWYVFGPPTAQNRAVGGCGCGAGTWLPLHCAALTHTIVPPAATCSVPAQSGGVGGFCCSALVGASREELGIEEKSKVGRERRLPLAPGPVVSWTVLWTIVWQRQSHHGSTGEVELGELLPTFLHSTVHSTTQCAGSASAPGGNTSRPTLCSCPPTCCPSNLYQGKSGKSFMKLTKLWKHKRWPQNTVLVFHLHCSYACDRHSHNIFIHC